MGKYITSFENHNIYQQLNFDHTNTPNISLCKSENEIHYQEFIPDPYNGYEFVDLNLPSGTKWSKMNVGAINETEYGNHYQYGKANNQYETTNSDNNYEGPEDPLDKSLDTATIVMGGNWHTPTKIQFNELIDNTTYTWETNFNNSNINGMKFTAINGNYVFFPAAGFYNNGTHDYGNNYGFYWSSTPLILSDSPISKGAYYLILFSGDTHVTFDNRYFGFSIRGVID